MRIEATYAALNQYDREKGPRRHLLGDHLAIQALRALVTQALGENPDRESINTFSATQCFFDHPVVPGSASHRALLNLYKQLIQGARPEDNYEFIVQQLTDVVQHIARCNEFGVNTQLVHPERQGNHYQMREEDYVATSQALFGSSKLE